MKLLIEWLDKLENVDLLINLYCCVKGALKVEKAKEVLKGLNLDIDNPIAHNNIANIYVSEGKGKSNNTL